METNTTFTENSNSLNSTNSNDHSINNTNNSLASKERWNCSLMNEFDYLVFCASLIGQATNYYRYGEKKNCSNHFRNVKWCLKMKSKNLDERKKMVLEREAEKEAQYIKKKSSLDAAREKFGDVTYHAQTTINDVFTYVEEDRSTFGVIPFENSIFGSVVTTLDSLVKSKVQIVDEIYLDVNHNLLSNSKFESITKVYSHPQAFGQCQNWINTYLKGVQHVEAFSTSDAAKKAAKEPNSAAVSSSVSAKIYGLKILVRDIQNVKDNKTRFFIIRKTSTTIPTGNDRTLLLFTVDHRRAGALCDCLKVFKDYNINLTKIDSRPSSQRHWHYVFFVELQGHKDESDVKKSLQELNGLCQSLKVLGSYQNLKPQEESNN
ncbi:7921_t:CDS:2 [Diversispora eburnea]|uniref:prephenate dehydratase n=1 Tax=Diversispora eburnea TaxID=1213867 RepID=A0A9N9BJ45_9GLOM|nr:7921_t:CDS:2 [Diversispora eburnea]